MRCHQALGPLHDDMATEACRLSPALVDAVHGVEAVGLSALGVDHHSSLLLIAVGPQLQLHGAVLQRRDAHDGGMAQARQFQKQVLVGERHGVVVGMGYFVGMAEGGGCFGAGKADTC